MALWWREAGACWRRWGRGSRGDDVKTSATTPSRPGPASPESPAGHWNGPGAVHQGGLSQPPVTAT